MFGLRNRVAILEAVVEALLTVLISKGHITHSEVQSQIIRQAGDDEASENDARSED